MLSALESTKNITAEKRTNHPITDAAIFLEGDNTNFMNALAIVIVIDIFVSRQVLLFSKTWYSYLH